MITIRLNYYDYAYNVNEILEQIACEFGVVKLELVLLNEVEQFSAWQLASGIDLSQTRLTINGESILGVEE